MVSKKLEENIQKKIDKGQDLINKKDNSKNIQSLLVVFNSNDQNNSVVATSTANSVNSIVTNGSPFKKSNKNFFS